MKLCACGCLKEIINLKSSYLKGHGRKNKKTSDEHRKKISLANVGKKKDKPAHNKGKVGIYKCSEETKQKIREVALSKGFGKWMTGKKASQETLDKLSKARLGHSVSDETKKKISDANSGEKNGMYKRGHSEESKEKIRQAAIDMWANNPDKMLAAMNTPEKKQKCREARAKVVLPLKNSLPEQKIEALLIECGLEYQKHKYIKFIENGYQCDVFLPDLNTIIEIDGLYWHNYPDYREIDIKRTKQVQDCGYKILRLWEHEVDKLDKDLFLTILDTFDKNCLSTIPITQKYKRFVKKYGII